MTAIWRATTTAALLLAAIPLTAEPVLHPVTEHGIRIRLYDYVGLSARDLAWTKEVATHILRRAGVRTIWLDCRINNKDRVKDADCELARTPLDLQLHILPKAMTERIQTGRYSLGRALIFAGVSHFAAAYYYRAKELEERGLANRYDILGSILAHEIGHLLLDSPGHAGKGLMRARWQDADLKKIACGEIRFSEINARRMVNAIRARAEMTARHFAEAQTPEAEAAPVDASGL